MVDSKVVEANTEKEKSKQLHPHDVNEDAHAMHLRKSEISEMARSETNDTKSR